MPLDYSAAIPVKSIAEEYSYIAAHPCSCKGRWQVGTQRLLEDTKGRHYDAVDAICRQCGQRKAFLFDINSFFGQERF